MHLQQPETLRVITAADRAAKKFCYKQSDIWFDPEDVRQDLLLDLLTRLNSFDPSRSGLPTFASICFQHRVARLGHNAQRNLQHCPTVSLHTPLSDTSNLTLADTLSAEDDLSQQSTTNSSALARIESLLDLDRALSSLSEEALALCALLILDQRDPVSASGLPRTTFYRRIAELRCHLLAAGIKPPSGPQAGVH